MNVPPFVPQPIEIPRNVAEERYAPRLRFVRRVAVLHLLSVAIIAATAALVPVSIGIDSSGGLSLFLLIALSTIRGVVKGRPTERRLSGVLLPFLLAALGLFSRDVATLGIPVWVLGLVPLCGIVCVALSGRDLSYIGMFVWSWLGSWALFGVSTIWLGATPAQVSFALIASAAYALFLVYDLAALLSRRRLGEEIGAVADLYRDLLNVVGYIPRVWLHWRRHRVWSVR